MPTVAEVAYCALNAPALITDLRRNSLGRAQTYALPMSIALAMDVSSWTVPDWLTVIGFPSALAALVIGAMQLSQAKEQSEAAARAAAAAETAILRTEKHLADVQLVSLLHEISTTQRELDTAVTNDNREDTIRHLGEYGRLSAEALAILEKRAHAGGGLIVSTLREATSIVGDAKNEIIAGERGPEVATRNARTHIGIVAGESIRILGAMKAFTNTADDGDPIGR